jgi:hypothetical protein
MDVLKPAKVKFAPNAKNVLIVNNSIVQPSSIGHGTANFNEQEKKINIDTDSLSIYCLGALTQEIESNFFFNSTQLISNSINRNTDFKKIYPILSDSIIKLCDSYNTNVLVALDKIIVEDVQLELYSENEDKYLSDLEVKIQTFWSIYYPNNSKHSNITFKDTVNWQAFGETNSIASFKLPKRQDALIDAALIVGRKMSKRFIPYWEKADRYFMITNNKTLKQGMDSIYVKNWQGAIKVWENLLANSNNQYLQVMLNNNLAICYEINGEVEKAFNSIYLAYMGYMKLYFVDTQKLMRISEYMNELAIRKSEIELLNNQLGKN